MAADGSARSLFTLVKSPCVRTPRAAAPPQVPYLYRCTSLTRKRSPLGPYRRPMPRVLWESQGGVRFLMSEAPRKTLYSSIDFLSREQAWGGWMAEADRGKPQPQPPAQTSNPKPQTKNPKPQNPNSRPQTPIPKPLTPRCGHARIAGASVAGAQAGGTQGGQAESGACKGGLRAVLRVYI